MRAQPEQRHTRLWFSTEQHCELHIVVSIIYVNAVMLKMFRKMEENVEMEFGPLIFKHVPPTT